jgi:prepilin-type processing-associated H-X9-DG protein
MIFLQSYSVDEPEGSGVSSHTYLSFRDIRTLAIVLLAFFLAMTPIYVSMRRQSEKHRCLQNIREIGAAMNQYATLNDDRLPPIYATGAQLEPQTDAMGRPFAYAALLTDFMSPRVNFRCPGAHADEETIVQHPARTDVGLPLTYGIYAPYSHYPRGQIPDPAQVVVLAETSNYGSRGTFNPSPFRDPAGDVVPVDGFLIGFENDNFDHRGSSAVTRLAFYDTRDGDFSAEKRSRHSDGIHVLYADGHYGVLPPPGARITRLGDLPSGLWGYPPPIPR